MTDAEKRRDELAKLAVDEHYKLCDAHGGGRDFDEGLFIAGFDAGRADHAAEMGRIFARSDIAPVSPAIADYVARIATLERELAAYKRAKAENDERFMLERDEWKVKCEKAEAELSRIRLGMGDDYGDDPILVIAALKARADAAEALAEGYRSQLVNERDDYLDAYADRDFWRAEAGRLKGDLIEITKEYSGEEVAMIAERYLAAHEARVKTREEGK